MDDPKVALRRARLAAIAGAPATAAESEAIAARVLALPAFANAACVVLYAALPGELDPAALWRAAAGKRILCAAAGPNGPELRAAPGLSAMLRTARGFLEPPVAPGVDPAAADVWVVPGLAFDPAGVRLGRGGGYYDRLLARRRPGSVAIGVLPERLRAHERLPRLPHDMAVDAIATELAWHEVR